MKIGLYFGSFNPIHIGHLIIANHVLEHASLDKIWFVVSPQNPFKASSSLLNKYDRLYLVQLAIENNDRFRASNIEFSLPQPSYTINTLTYLEEKYPDDEFHIIMGSDSYQNLENWKNAAQIIANYPIIVYQRPGFAVAKIIENSRSTVLEAPYLDISAGYIRKLIKEGKSIQYLTPQTIADYITESGFYKK